MTLSVGEGRFWFGCKPLLRHVCRTVSKKIHSKFPQQITSLPRPDERAVRRRREPVGTHTGNGTLQHDSFANVLLLFRRLMCQAGHPKICKMKVVWMDNPRP